MAGQAHWADTYAEKIIREKGDKELYVCAAGVTPSGTVHIGNFREIISVELVVRALRQRGKKVRFIYSWDDYDVFRKVPANMPRQEELAEYLRRPITATPDPYGREESYARHNEREMEELLPVVGIEPEYLYQANAYRASRYAQGIRTALEQRERLRAILNAHRTSPLEKEWWPVSVFCTACERDTTGVDSWDGEYSLGYHCDSCGNRQEVDLRATSAVKLLWRVDWPMRWAFEKVDFEPAGKDHHSEGGSFDTGRRIVAEVYGFQAPTSFQYDFIGIKGRGGKISSSSGEVVSLADVLEVYQPELVRYLFASTRPNTEFAISFDLDVIKNYEDYDRSERIYFGAETVSGKRAEKERRIYELSQVRRVPPSLPAQVSFRHLSTVVQINEGDVEQTVASLGVEAAGEALDRVKTRARCAWNWVRRHAPESFRFSLRDPASAAPEVDPREREALARLRREIEENLEHHDEASLSTAVYDVARQCGVEPKKLFKAVYRALIGKEMGPRLAGFILTVGKSRIVRLLAAY